MHFLVGPNIQTIDGCSQRFNGGFNNILINTNAPYHFVILGNGYIGHGFGGRTLGQRMFFIVGQLIGEAQPDLQSLADCV